MKALLGALVVLFSTCVVPSSATYCYGIRRGYSDDWLCNYYCCYDFYRCCSGSFTSVYWYAWVIIVIFILLCVCACAGGGYGYRRYYYVKRIHYPPPTTATVVTTATARTSNQGYQFNPDLYSKQYIYQPCATPQDAPPPYNPSAGYPYEPPKY